MLTIVFRCLAVAAAVLAVACVGWYYLPSMLAPGEQARSDRAPGTAPGPAERPAGMARRVKEDQLFVPPDVARHMGLEAHAVTARPRRRKLAPFQGCLAIPPESLARARSRFAGEVVEVHLTRPGAEVEAGQVLAVVWSKDLGEKKSELVDAQARLDADEQLLKRLRELYGQGGTPERSVRDAERAVAASRIAVAKAERTLRSWKLTDAEIGAVYKEARSPNKQGAAKWAEVKVVAPRAGVIVEMNVHQGDIIDTTADLYKVADLSSLQFWAHVYEEDLRLLSALPRPVKCGVTLPAVPGMKPIESTLERVAPVIDPNQHTALVTGRVPNPGGQYKAGQFVTVSVELPPLEGEVELPADSVVEDGETSVVFVPVGEHTYKRVKVDVTRRFQDVIYIKATPHGIRPKQEVVTHGALMLKAAMDHLPPPRADEPPNSPTTSLLNPPTWYAA